MRKLLFILPVLLFSAINTFAAQNDVEMATELRSSGKIYVVVAVMCVIFFGLIAYLFSIDRRLKKIENQD